MESQIEQVTPASVAAMSAKFVVEIEEGCWLAKWEGDPGRTLCLESAQRFKSEKTAQRALDAARKYRPLRNAVIKAECAALAPALLLDLRVVTITAEHQSIREVTSLTFQDVDASLFTLPDLPVKLDGLDSRISTARSLGRAESVSRMEGDRARIVGAFGLR